MCSDFTQINQASYSNSTHFSDVALLCTDVKNDEIPRTFPNSRNVWGVYQCERNMHARTTRYSAPGDSLRSDTRNMGKPLLDAYKSTLQDYLRLTGGK